MSSGQSSTEKAPESNGFFSGFFKMLSSFALKLNPFAEKQLSALASPSRPDWRKQTTEIWQRPFERLPLDVDLPRLAARVSIEDHRTCDPELLLPVDPNEREGDPAFQKLDRPANIDLRVKAGPQAGANANALNAATTEAAKKSYRAVCELLYEIIYVFGGGREKADAARAKFLTDLAQDSELTVQKTLLRAYLSEVIGEDTPAGRILRAINQAIIAPGNKEALVNLLPGVFFKDSQQRPWEVVVRVFDDHNEVSHLRGQCNLQPRPDAAFTFLLETAFVFDKNAENMTEAHIYVDEYAFGPQTSEACKAQFSKLFDANLRPVPKGAVPPARVISNVGRRVANYTAVLAASEPKPEESEAKTEESEPKTEESKPEEAVPKADEAATASATEEKAEAPSTEEEKKPEAPSE